MLTGRCQCGEIQYECTEEPVAIYVCHCRECQKQSASAFGISVEVPHARFRIVRGNPKYWTRLTDSGNKLKCAFCENCGTRPWHENEPQTNTLSIKGGSLDKTVDISNAIHVWTSRKLPGIIIPDNVVQYPKESS